MTVLPELGAGAGAKRCGAGGAVQQRRVGAVVGGAVRSATTSTPFSFLSVSLELRFGGRAEGRAEDKDVGGIREYGTGEKRQSTVRLSLYSFSTGSSALVCFSSSFLSLVVLFRARGENVTLKRRCGGGLANTHEKAGRY